MCEGPGFSYLSIEKPFVEYFNRCKGIGMSFDDINKNFNYLELYYDDIVSDKRADKHPFESLFKLYTLDALFNNWKKYN